MSASKQAQSDSVRIADLMSLGGVKIRSIKPKLSLREIQTLRTAVYYTLKECKDVTEIIAHPLSDSKLLFTVAIKKSPKAGLEAFHDSLPSRFPSRHVL